MRAPSLRRPASEKAPGLGARGTKEQDFAGIRAPSLRRPIAEKAPGLGARETEEQGFAGIRAPSPSRPIAEKAPGLGARETEKQGFSGMRAPSLRRPASAAQSPRTGRPPPRKAPAPPGLRCAKPPRRPPRKITKSVKTPGASGSIPLLSGLAASQYFLGFDGFKFAGSSYFPELSISSWMS